MEELVNKYNTLQRWIFTVIKENRCRGDDNVIDSLDLLEQSEEEFGATLLDFLIEAQSNEE